MTPETKSAYNTAEEWMNRLIIYNTFKKEKIPFYSYDEEFTDVKPIGRKSSGKIYKATLRSLRKTVAIKSINLTVDDAMNEIKKHQILENHDNILKFYGITRQGDYMLVYEYANNGTLRQYLRENYQRMSWNVKLSLARQIAGVIGFLHANEIVYEKLDSENIFVHNGKIKLSGFEIRRQSINASRQNSNSQYLESPGAIYRKTSLDRNSLGILLWEISSGTPPKVIMNDNREHVLGTPRAYVKICEDCCQPNKNRWPSIEQVIRELDEIDLSEIESGFFNLTSSLGRTKDVNMENGIAAEPDSFTSEMDLFMKNLFTFFSELFVKQHLDMMPICIKKFIKDHNKNPTKILYNLVSQRRPYYTSMVGFFYKHSIGTIADNKIALEFYSQATNGVIDERDHSSDVWQRMKKGLFDFSRKQQKRDPLEH
ncbi:812_t:CDS:2 [Acaulospora morrowiae]|uniref:812_t:CDS:1 n=1 Tax=Acaulospora morrowiae TaxID=94023 RepID=A0A9N9CSV7_9GLOM|nr:812_t:CDS:2 [Acaulospora morrowiae]